MSTAHDPIRVFIGYDPRQPVAVQVVAHSVFTRASVPVAITPLKLATLPMTRRGLTEFTYSRFLVPYLSGYRGLSIFLDADMLCLGDVKELLQHAHEDADRDLWVVQNERRFEWPSLMVFNNARCTVLTPEYVDNPKSPVMELTWATRIGALPREWNQLVCYDPPNPDAKLVHFTQGIPCWPETKGVEFSDAWHKEAQASMSTVSFDALMGNSVHAKHVRERLAKVG